MTIIDMGRALGEQQPASQDFGQTIEFRPFGWYCGIGYAWLYEDDEPEQESADANNL